MAAVVAHEVKSHVIYSELLKVPFMLRLPGARVTGRRKAIVQFHDVLPTLFDLLGLGGLDSALTGRSFSRVLLGDEADRHRDVVITGYHEGVDRGAAKCRGCTHRATTARLPSRHK